MGKGLKHLLRDSSLATWEAFAAEVNGSWSAPEGHNEVRIEIPHAHGPIVLERDVQMVFVGKVLMPVVSSVFSALRPSLPAYRFTVSRASFATTVAQWFGHHDIAVQDPEFDRDFVLKGETPGLVRMLFADAALRERYRDDFDGTLALKDDTAAWTDPTPGFDPLELTVSGIVEDGAKLRRLHALFAATLDRLALISTAPS